MRKLLRLALYATLAVVLIVSILVQIPSSPNLESLGGGNKAKALILYHPSRDAHFTDDLSIAIANGLKSAGFSVDRTTLNLSTDNSPNEYSLIVIVSNTYYWTPDLPTLWYLRRANLKGVNVLAVIAGAGSTDRAKRLLEDSLQASGANIVASRAYWLLRPNDESRMSEPNRSVALEKASLLAHDIAAKLGLGDGYAAAPGEDTQ